MKTNALLPQDDVTALHIAVYNKHSEVVRILAKKEDPKVLNACDRVSCLKSIQVVWFTLLV